MAKLDRLERLTDLVLVLLSATRPMTLDAIAHEIPGYPEDRDARRQAFERDKRLLREEGIPVATEPVGGQEQFGYRIDPAAYYLPDLGLAPDEQTALHLAVAGVHLGDPSGRDALAKLGAIGLGDVLPVASLVPPPALAAVFDGVRTRAKITFAYRGEERAVAPAGLWFRGGRWYLVGWDRDRQAGRTFRVDRLEGPPAVGLPGSGAPPEGFDAAAAAPEEPLRPGEGDETDVLLRVDPVEAVRVTGEVGDDAVVGTDGNGWVQLRVRSASDDVLRSWVLGMLDHAEVVGPPRARDAMVTWLRSILHPGSRRSAGSPQDGGARRIGQGDGVAGSVGTAGRVGQGRDARSRLRRLLAVVGWLARVGEAPIAEISRRFGIAEDELVRELELAACCGLPPYTPDTLMEIEVNEDRVRAFLPDDLARPRRLSAAEGLAVAAAGRTILAVPGADEDGSLARALAKLDTALGLDRGLVVRLDDPRLLADVRRAVDDRSRVEIEYHSASTDETTQRLVDPVQAVSLDGHWYLDGYCHRAGGMRRFRVDRIRSLEVIGPQPPDGPARTPLAPDAFVPGPGATVVRLAVDAEASWVVDSIPCTAVPASDDGALEVILEVGGRAWLERLLLQLGPHARVLDPPDLVDLGPQAARRVLRRYGEA